MSIADAKARDSEAADMWFDGPKSFTALAARDRRELLGIVDRLAPLVQLLVDLDELARYADQKKFAVALREAAVKARAALEGIPTESQLACSVCGRTYPHSTPCDSPENGPASPANSAHSQDVKL